MNSVMASDTSYKTATEILMFYINNANIESAYALLKDQEVTIDMPNDIGMTPLHQSVKVNNLSFVNLLLDFGANPNTKTEEKVGNDTPLLLACENNYYEVAKLLLDYGADPTAKNSKGMGCIHLACMNGCLDMALLLIQRGCDPNIRDSFGNNCSFWALRNGYKEMLPFLPPPATVSPLENKNYKDAIEEHYLLITADEKKKMMKGKKGKGKKKK